MNQTKNKHILVTGAAGFIGSHLCEALLEKGERVTGVDNFDPFYARELKENNLQTSLKNERFNFIEGDFSDVAILESLAKNEVTDVVHLAALAGVRPSVSDPQRFFEVNVSKTLKMIEVLSDFCEVNWVLGSSSSVYGDSESTPFVEDSVCGRPLSPYAASKRAMELVAHSQYWLRKFKVVCLRFFTVIGPRQRPDLAIHKFVNLISNGEKVQLFGAMDSARDYTYVSDIVQGCMSSVEWVRNQNHPVYEIINLGNETPITLADMLGTIEAGLGKKANTERLPRQKGDVVCTFASTEKAKRLLGYEPTVPFSEGVQSLIEWYRTKPK